MLKERQDPPTRRVVSRAAALSIASLGFVVVGVVRMKLAATELGVAPVAAFGQASLIQSMAVTLSIAGVVTAGRVRISDGRLSADERRATAWSMFRRPMIVTTVLAPAALAISPWVSLWLLGSSDWTTLVAMAVLGIVPLVLAQVALAIVQVMGSQRELYAGSFGYLLLGTLSTVALVLPGSVNLASVSFLASPIMQLLALVVACPSLRKLRSGQARSVRPRFQASAIASASITVSLGALGAETFVRARLVHVVGLDQVALLQPGQLFATQAFALFTASLTQVLMVEQNLHTDRNSAQFRKGPWRTSLVLAGLALVLAAVLSAAGPTLIRLFFSQAFAVALPIMVLSLAVEPLRAVAWVGGSTLLPQGRVYSWAVIQLTWLSGQLVTTLVLLPELKAAAVPIGYLVGVGLNASLTFALLKPRLDIWGWFAAFAVILGTAAMVMTASMNWGYRLAPACLGTLAVLSLLGGRTRASFSNR